MRIALLSAAVRGDNAGDAMIEDAVRRLVVADEFRRFPLTSSLSDEDIDGINRCDTAVICGTNLYQTFFACNLTCDTLDRIHIPIVPLGIGSSAAIRHIPMMDRKGIQAVRALHARCAVSSVRDTASARFLRSIGVRKFMLTGCPVLFHALHCPDFSRRGDGEYTLSPRARLLHIRNSWNDRQLETLKRLCERYHPAIVLQSPYDLPLAEQLKSDYGVRIIYDPEWQAGLYSKTASETSMAFGFRLHYNMLAMSYGKPAFFIAHDSRTWEFCELMRIPCFNITQYSDNALMLRIDACAFDGNQVRRRWHELALDMKRCLEANGLATRLDASPPVCPAPTSARQRRPRLLLLVDKPDWSFDHSARQIARCLRHDFSFNIHYVTRQPRLDTRACDLLYIFFWGEDYYKPFGFSPGQIIKEVSSHRWEDDPRFGPCSPSEITAKYLNDADAVVCTSLRLMERLKGCHPHIAHTPNGFNPRWFYMNRKRSGPMTIGWAGNIRDPIKRFNDVLEPACRGRFNLVCATGNTPHRRMNDFYNQLDLFAVTSTNEGEPLTLVEAMAAGCFPVASNVGIVPELIRHGENGLIVNDASPESFRDAFTWCESHLEQVRRAGEGNAEYMRRERDWAVMALFFKRVFMDTWNRYQRPYFRNDDVGWDTPTERFRQFCAIFHAHGLTQLHGIALHGRVCAFHRFGNNAVEYEGMDTIANLDNNRIRELSRGMRFEDRPDLIDFLATNPDSIALHGLYHTDYSKMSAEDQRRDIADGLAVLQRLFPHKPVKHFIPPFNRTNDATAAICRELGLELLTTQGVHLEDRISAFSFLPRTWYRYHHHRFYPESAFDYYRLSLELLEETFARHFSTQPSDPGLFPLSDLSWIQRMKRKFRLS